MSGARGILKAPPYQSPGQIKMAGLRARVGKTPKAAARASAKLATATAVVQQLVDRKRGIVTVKDVTALAKVTGEPALVILGIVEQAKQTFSDAALDYVNIHKQATKDALANGDAKSLAVATAASQWAIEKIEHAGKRIISKEQAVQGPTGTRILIGISLGGKNPTHFETETIDVQTPTSTEKI